MLEQREAGEEPDFDGFMERYGDFFPQNPQSLDELLEQMAQSMAQMQQLMNSMSPEQRAPAPGARRVADRGHGPAVAGRSALPQPPAGVPAAAVGAVMGFRGDDPLSMSQMPGLLDTLGDMDDLEHLLRQATQPGELAEVDLDRAREIARRRRGPLARAARRAGPHARGGRADRAA